MADREKVIEGQKQVILHLHRMSEIGYDGDAPYYEDLRGKAEDALELLKEQEPVNPQKMLDGSWSYERCGACGNVLYERSFAYCPCCGRKVKWDDK